MGNSRPWAAGLVERVKPPASSISPALTTALNVAPIRFGLGGSVVSLARTSSAVNCSRVSAANRMAFRTSSTYAGNRCTTLAIPFCFSSLPLGRPTGRPWQTSQTSRQPPTLVGSASQAGQLKRDICKFIYLPLWFAFICSAGDCE